MAREKVREVKDEVTLHQEKKNNDHERRERLHDVINWSVVLFIISTFMALFVLFVLLIWQWYTTGDWDSIYKLISAVVGAIFGYMLSYLRHSGVEF